MNILYLSYDGLTDPLGQSQILPYLVHCSKNHQITILSFEKPEAFKTHKDAVTTTVQENSITWFPCKYTKSPPIISTLIDVNDMWRRTSKLCKKVNFDLVHCRSYVTAIVAFRLKRKFKTKVLFDIRGFWADERIEGKIWSLSNPVQKALYHKIKRLEKDWFLIADGIISLTQQAKKEITANIQPKANPDNIAVIPCCADEVLFDPALISKQQISALKSDLGINENEIVLGYIGSIGTWYLTADMMRQFKSLQANGLVHKFLWITKESPTEIHRMAAEMNLTSSMFIIKSAHRSEMPLHIAAMQAGIFYILPSYSKKASSPTKLGELLLMGKPVISNRDIGDLDELLAQNNIGICHSPDEEISTEAFENLLKIPADEIRSVAMKNLSLSMGGNKYLEMYQKLS